jgi:hypothetical protein
MRKIIDYTFQDGAFNIKVISILKNCVLVVYVFYENHPKAIYRVDKIDIAKNTRSTA